MSGRCRCRRCRFGGGGVGVKTSRPTPSVPGRCGACWSAPGRRLGPDVYRLWTPRLCCMSPASRARSARCGLCSRIAAPATGTCSRRHHSGHSTSTVDMTPPFATRTRYSASDHGTTGVGTRRLGRPPPPKAPPPAPARHRHCEPSARSTAPGVDTDQLIARTAAPPDTARRGPTVTTPAVGDGRR